MPLDWASPDYAEVWDGRIAALKRLSAADSGTVAALKAYYAERPVDFVRDWCITFDPRLVERGIEATVPFVPFERQSEYIE